MSIVQKLPFEIWYFLHFTHLYHLKTLCFSTIKLSLHISTLLICTKDVILIFTGNMQPYDYLSQYTLLCLFFKEYHSRQRHFPNTSCLKRCFRLQPIIICLYIIYFLPNWYLVDVKHISRITSLNVRLFPVSCYSKLTNLNKEIIYL